MSFSQAVSPLTLRAGVLLSTLLFGACAGGGAAVSPLSEAALPMGAQSRAAESSSASTTASPWGYGRHHFGVGRWMRSLNLSDQQRAQIRQLVQQYRQAHPRGNTFDPQAHKALRQQIFAVLSPQQQTQIKENMQRFRGGPMRSIALSDQQRAQLRQLMQQYRQAHPRGSTFDPQARQALHEQMFNVLTPQQQAQFKQNFQQTTPNDSHPL
jgi:Spy/CpxP family protein refolding chaperone